MSNNNFNLFKEYQNNFHCQECQSRKLVEISHHTEEHDDGEVWHIISCQCNGCKQSHGVIFFDECPCGWKTDRPEMVEEMIIKYQEEAEDE